MDGLSNARAWKTQENEIDAFDKKLALLGSIQAMRSELAGYLDMVSADPGYVFEPTKGKDGRRVASLWVSLIPSMPVAPSRMGIPELNHLMTTLHYMEQNAAATAKELAAQAHEIFLRMQRTAADPSAFAAYAKESFVEMIQDGVGIPDEIRHVLIAELSRRITPFSVKRLRTEACIKCSAPSTNKCKACDMPFCGQQCFVGHKACF